MKTFSESKLDVDMQSNLAFDGINPDKEALRASIAQDIAEFESRQRVKECPSCTFSDTPSNQREMDRNSWATKMDKQT